MGLKGDFDIHTIKKDALDTQGIKKFGFQTIDPNFLDIKPIPSKVR
jgi:hypothetical protein